MIATTKYYEEFLRYYQMAKIQQNECNLGKTPHKKGSVKDRLMREVHLYDVVERRYAGFTQLLLDMVYGNTRKHPYYGNMHDVRAPIARAFTGWWKHLKLEDQLYVFLVHRLTGSAINYARSPSGYWNTVLPSFSECGNIREMSKVIREFEPPKFTSVGYQFPAFPKPTARYKRGGDYFMCEMMPDLSKKLARFLEKGPKKDLRQIGDFMFQWNQSKDLRRYAFQYAAVISDIADFFPEYVNRESHFYYGSNAAECLSYMIEGGGRSEKKFDQLMEKAMRDTCNVPYNLEDVMCDCIRWIENYIRPGGDYDHIDRDKVWSSHRIKDHPFGRQKPMLKLGLIKSFNDLSNHPSDDYVLRNAGMSVSEYKEKTR